MSKKKENRFFKGLKFIGKWGYKICIGVAAATVYIQPVSATIVTVAAVCSGISATFKDKTNTRFDKLNKVVNGFKAVSNALALNYGNAKNDPKVNK